MPGHDVGAHTEDVNEATVEEFIVTEADHPPRVIARSAERLEQLLRRDARTPWTGEVGRASPAERLSQLREALIAELGAMTPPDETEQTRCAPVQPSVQAAAQEWLPTLEAQKMKRGLIVGVVALPALVAGAAFLGALTGQSPAIRTATPVAHRGGHAAAGPPPRPGLPPQLQLVTPQVGASALASGRWAVAYSYAGAQNNESTTSPRYILTVPAGADIRIAAIVPPAGVARISYYVSPAVNVVTDLRRYSAGAGTDVIVTGPGTGPIAPAG